MRFARVGAAGQERPVVLRDDNSGVDVTSLVGDFGHAFFATGGLRELDSRVADVESELPVVNLDEERVGPPVARPGKVVCVGLNYSGHVAETGQATPTEPTIFFKAPNAVVGPYDDVLIPRGSRRTDWEVELCVVIGATARYLSDETAAADVIAGYTITNDVSERSFQLRRGGQWVKGKSCETFNPLGPWVVTPDELGDPQSLDLHLEVNGDVMQSGSTAEMIFSVTHLVHHISQFMVLEPGDIINTGTPAGVGMGQSPPRFLQAGDVMRSEIDKLGHQLSTCRDAT